MISSPSARWSRWDVALVFLISVAAAWFSRYPFNAPEPAGGGAPDSAFSAERAMEHLRVIAKAPHVPGSPEHRSVREYLFDQLHDLGLQTAYQSTTWLRELRGTRAVALWNVLGRLPGSAPSGAVLLMAHYDAVPHSPGANDDGTSVAVILETLRALRAGPALKNDLIVLFTDGEELGRMGARAFVAEHPWSSDVSVVVNLEIRGRGGASWMFETGRENGWIIRSFAVADPRPVANSMTVDIYRTMSAYTDYSSFRDTGVQGLNFSTVGANGYHLALDNLEHTSPSTIQHQGIHALSLARYLGNADLTETKTPDVAFATVPVLGLIAYRPFGNWAGVFLAGVLVGVTLVLGRRRGTIRLRGLLVGSAVAAISPLTTGFMSAELYDWLRGVHHEYPLLQGSSFHEEGWYCLSVVVMSWAVFLSMLAIARRWFRLSELALGGVLISVVGATAMVIWLPLASLNLVWPSFFGAAALLWFLLLLEAPSPKQRSRTIQLMVLGLLLLPVFTFLVPATELLCRVVGISQAPAFAFSATLGLVLVLPLSAPLESVYRWRGPTLLGLLALVFLGLGVSGSRATAGRPTPARLFYVMDRDGRRAWWATADRSDNRWIRDRVPDTEAHEAQGESDFYPAGYATAPADPVAATAPDVRVLRDTIQGDRRVVRLSISSRIQAEVLDFRPGNGVEAALLAVDDRALDRGGTTGGYTAWPLSHWGDPRDGTMEVELSLPADAEAPTFLLREISYRPGELLGPDAFRRPPHLIPSPVGISDVAILGTRIALASP